VRPQAILRYVGLALLLSCAFMILSCCISYAGGDDGLLALGYGALVAGLIGLLPLVFVPPVRALSAKEGLTVVVLSWLLSCLVGAVPYVLWGGPFSLTNAWFESVSGYTTTGSSILSHIEGLPRGLLFWRAATHWIGGMGIVLFMLAVLPAMGMSGGVLLRSEASALAREGLQAHSQQVVRILWRVYVGLTLAQTGLLWICGMSLFDAVTHSFATIATGGFSSWDRSIAHFDSPLIEAVITVFMVLSGLHFGLLFAAAAGAVRDLWASDVVRYYLAGLAVGVAICTLSLQLRDGSGWWPCFRVAAFQVASVGTSTGFATADTAAWPGAAQLVLLFMTLQCACSGSTSGGIKADRMVIFGGAFVRHVRQLMHPRGILPVWREGHPVGREVLEESLLYIATYLGIALVATLALSALGVDLLSAFSGTVATMGNVGPGLGSVGSAANFGHLPAAAKWVLTATMLLGRLEIFALILLLTPGHWRDTAGY